MRPMHVTLRHVRMDAALTVERVGDVLVLGGEAFDLSPFEDGDDLPAEATGSAWFQETLSCRDGVLHVVLALPFGGPEANVLGEGPVYAWPATLPEVMP